MLLLIATWSHATNYTVTTVTATGAGSLSQAISDANAAAGADTITFDSVLFATPQTITLPAEQSINPAGGALTITGPGPHMLTLTQSSSVRLFSLTATGANLTLSGVRLAGGREGGVGGGAIKITMGTLTDTCSLTLTNCILHDNTTTGNGGAIHCGGPGVTMNVTDCLFSNNAANGTGGAIIFNGNFSTTPITVNMTNTTFLSNSATTSSGGAIRNTGTSPLNLTLKNCTMHGNSAGTSGGAITVGNGTFTLVNCTVTGNNATTSHGGAVYLQHLHHFSAQHDGGGEHGAHRAQCGLGRRHLFQRRGQPDR